MKNFVNIKTVINRAAISRSGIYNKLNENSPSFDPSFPKPVKVGMRSIRFIDEEVSLWIDQQADKRLEVRESNV